jgi:phospholipid/cholesterol/gamma-HCH transport system substrate-binding protein
VLDEPTAGLDPDRSENFVKLLGCCRRNSGFTVVMVTHDPETLAGLATRLAVLADQRIVACGTAARSGGGRSSLHSQLFQFQTCAQRRSGREPASHGESIACPGGRAVHAASRSCGGALDLVVRGQARGDPDYTVVTRYNVTGLSLQGQVRYRGIRVGKVQAIELDPEDGQNILIRISVDRAVPVTRGTTAKLAYQGVTGIAHILLEDKGDDPTPLRGRRRRAAAHRMQSSLIEELSDVGGATLRQARDLLASANQVLDARTGNSWPGYLPTSKRRRATATSWHSSCASCWLRRTVALLQATLTHAAQAGGGDAGPCWSTPVVWWFACRRSATSSMCSSATPRRLASAPWHRASMNLAARCRRTSRQLNRLLQMLEDRRRASSSGRRSKPPDPARPVLSRRQAARNHHEEVADHSGRVPARGCAGGRRRRRSPTCMTSGLPPSGWPKGPAGRASRSKSGRRTGSTRWVSNIACSTKPAQVAQLRGQPLGGSTGQLLRSACGSSSASWPVPMPARRGQLSAAPRAAGVLAAVRYAASSRACCRAAPACSTPGVG